MNLLKRFFLKTISLIRDTFIFAFSRKPDTKKPQIDEEEKKIDESINNNRNRNQESEDFVGLNENKQNSITIKSSNNADKVKSDSEKDTEDEKGNLDELRKNIKNIPYKRKTIDDRIVEEEKKSKKEKRDIKQNRVLDLGGIKNTKRNLEIKKRIKSDSKKRENRKALVKSPYVEINFDVQAVYLILPQQKIKLDSRIQGDDKAQYKILLDNEEKIIDLKITEADEYSYIDIKRIKIEEPLESFEVNYPKILDNRVFTYRQPNKNVYAFVSKKNNTGKLYYLFDQDGNYNNIPKKDIWLLFDIEKIHLETEPFLIDTNYIWDRYNPALYKLKESKEIVLRNDEDNTIQSIGCEDNFNLVGKEDIEDDLSDLSPIFSDSDIVLKSSKENRKGWVVWLQNNIISYNWNGVDELNLKEYEKIFDDYGEYQISICNKKSNVPIETIPFRYLPGIEIKYRDHFKPPEENTGYSIENLEVFFNDSYLKWRIFSEQEFKVATNGYKALIDEENDTINFKIAKRATPKNRVPIQVTIPKIKWRISNTNWTSKYVDINRDMIDFSKNNYLYTKISGNKEFFKIIAFIDDDNGQESHFIRKKDFFEVSLNRYMDTIKEYKDESVRFKLKINNLKNEREEFEINIFEISAKTIFCKLCDTKCFNKPDFHRHLFVEHWPEIYTEMKLWEMKIYLADLPVGIYQCKGCKAYIKATNPENPEVSIQHHVKKCYKFDNYPNYPIKKRYKTVSSIREIQNNVMKNLPRWYRCNICKEEIKTKLEGALNHIYRHHENELYYYK
jgi:hypothetical protein